MKDNIKLFKLFLGIFMVLIGAMIFLSTFFNISIPIFKTVVSFILIYSGMIILVGKKSLFFLTERVDNNIKDCIILLSSNHIDISDVEKKQTLNIDVILGHGIVYIRKGINCKIYSTSVLGRISVPDGDNIVWGSKNIKIDKNSDEGLTIIATVVLGSLEIVEK